MSFLFTVTDESDQQRPTIADEVLIDGEDIACLENGIVENAGGTDFATVSGRQAAFQSVVREAGANPGEIPQRPEWGFGAPGMLFKGRTITTRDKLEARARARLSVNPRVSRVDEVTTSLEDEGTSLKMSVESIHGRIEVNHVVRPPGVR